MKPKSCFFILALTAAAACAQDPAPQLAISGNGSQHVTLYRGWPLLVQISVLHSQRLQKSPVPADLELSPATGNWFDNVTLNASPDAPIGALQLAQPPDTPTLDLPARGIFQAVWQMDGDATAALTAGTYSVTAHLEIDDGSGWMGAVDSTPMTLTVADEPSPLTDDQVSDKALLQARFAGNRGDFVGAAATVDTLLAAQSANWHALEYRALLYEQAGDLPHALAAASASIQAAAVAPGTPGDVFTGARVIQEPPEFLLQLQSRLQASLAANQSSNRKTRPTRR